MKKWELHIIAIITHPDHVFSFNEQIKSLGEYGWELVCIYEGKMYFKREVEQ